MADPEEISVKDEIERLAAAVPSVPFAIVMVSGQRYEIANRDAVSVGKSVVSVFPNAGGYHLLRQSQISEVSVPKDEVP
jgi:hypothetical protein